MIIPDLTGVANALKQILDTATSTFTSSATEEDVTIATPALSETRTWMGRTRSRGVSRASALLEAAFRAESREPGDYRSSYESDDVEKRQIAQTSVIVGVPMAATRTTTIRSTSTIQQTTVVENGTTRTAASSVSVVTRTVTRSATTTTSGLEITASASLTVSSTADASTPVSTVTAPLASPPPTCPDASLDQITDSTGIPYLIKCSTTNSGSAYELIKVDTGGYGQCFSSCSTRGDCVGFSFVGNDSGVCYLRNVQSSDNDDTALVSSYVTCYKVDPSAVADEDPASDSRSGGSNIGAIAGGVVGGIVALILLLALIAFFVRRHRKKVDERGEKRNVGRPILPPQDQYYDGFHRSTNVASVSSGGHHRSGSTANDMFMSEGAKHLSRQRSGSDVGLTGGFVQVPVTKKSADLFGGPTGARAYASNTSSYTSEPGARAEGGVAKAGAFRRPQMLDGTPIGAASRLKQSGSNSSWFDEHMVELEDTSSHRSPIAQESPVLGRNSPRSELAKDVRRTQHIMAWNRSDVRADAPMSANLTPRTPPSARSKTFSRSSKKAGLPRDASPVVSLLRGSSSSRQMTPETLGSGVYKP